jgi:hypothetical protein
MKRRSTVEISRDAEVHVTYGYPWRRYFGDMGFDRPNTKAQRTTLRPSKGSTSPRSHA